ncbi:hypothetical protein CHS0354_009501 [Potamilus streckersoni]|uniref:Uncharacterized protein n=1 Tax=Potamilus streckersoni TaxID=2493646 RepID=A0AAE0VKZ1_9BIVA|nr:hypothetical protein CHS0354_009501 [Potamilus streckersoni]
MMSWCIFFLTFVLLASSVNIRPKKLTGCPDGSHEVHCKTNPCEVTDCPAYPEANCVPNYCQGCNAVFFVDGKEVDCNEKK